MRWFSSQSAQVAADIGLTAGGSLAIAALTPFLVACMEILSAVASHVDETSPASHVSPPAGRG